MKRQIKLFAEVVLLAAMFTAAQINHAPAQTTVRPCAYSALTGTCRQAADNAPFTITGITNIQTYSSAVVALANTAAGDVFCVIGSATKLVKVKRIRVSVTASSAIVGDVALILRSTLDTGGGLATLTPTANDQLNAAATTTVNYFTSAPTSGTAIGTVRARKIAAGTQGNTATTTEAMFDFAAYYDQPLVLRGAAQALCVNTSAFGTGASWDIDEEHTEE